MIGSVILLLLSLTLIFICIYTAYYFLISITSRNRRRFVRNGKYNLANYFNNIVVIIYSHNNKKETASLLEALNKQNYPKENYKTYIILDNCTDDSSNMLEMIGGANIFRVGDSYTVGKDESISQLLDRLIAFKTIDAYVFLGANRGIDENFLSTVNQGLMNHNVLVASTVLTGIPGSLKENILNAYNTYENNIINTSRSILGLSALINSDCCVIRQNVIEKVQCIDFKDINTELKYSVMLSKLNFKTSFDPNIVTYLNIKNYSLRKPSFSYRITLLKNSLTMMPRSNFMFNEFLLAGIQPGAIILILTLVFLLWVTMVSNFNSRMLNSTVILSVILVLILSFAYSLLNSKLKFKEELYLILYPIYSMLLLLSKLPIIKQICNYCYNRKHPKHFESHSIPVVVAAGNKKMNCAIELVEEDNMVRAIFKFKNKKQSTDLYLRVFDAIKSVSNMLAEKEYEIVDPDTKEVVEKGNFDLRICQNCKYFTSKIDGTINIIKGTCSCNNSEYNNTAENIVMLWHCCNNYAPAKEKIVDLDQYRKGS